MTPILLTLVVLGSCGLLLGFEAYLIEKWKGVSMGDDLFEWGEKNPAAQEEEQVENITRARDKIAPLIRSFRQERRSNGGEFHADDLRDYVRERLPTAPASPDRILRAMRQDGEINYVVVNRRGSLYRFVYEQQIAAE